MSIFSTSFTFEKVRIIFCSRTVRNCFSFFFSNFRHQFLSSIMNNFLFSWNSLDQLTTYFCTVLIFIIHVLNFVSFFTIYCIFNSLITLIKFRISNSFFTFSSNNFIFVSISVTIFSSNFDYFIHCWDSFSID